MVITGVVDEGGEDVVDEGTGMCSGTDSLRRDDTSSALAGWSSSAVSESL